MTLTSYLKSQIEVVFINLMKIMDSRPLSIKEIVLEFILDVTKEHQLVTDLFVNFDCDPSCPSILEALCKFLYRVRKPFLLVS